MRQIFLEKGSVALHAVDTPLCGEKELLVQVHYSFMSSGTEYATLSNAKKSLAKKFFNNLSQNTQKIIGALREHGLTGTKVLLQSKMHQVMPLGYSCSGQVIQIGSQVKSFKIGDLVACSGAGIAHHAEQVTVPENLAVKIASHEQLKAASITSIGAIALQALRRADIKLGEKVYIVGLGLLGQVLVQLVKLNGGQVFASDIDPQRLSQAQQLGADYIFNGQTENIATSLTFMTHHQGVDVTIITAASQSGELINQAMHITRRKGKVVLVGDVKLDFDREAFYAKEIDLLISCSTGPGRYDPTYEKEGHDYPYAYVRWTEKRNMEYFVSLITEKKITIDPLITHEFALEQVKEAYASLMQKKSLGIVLRYDANQGEQRTRSWIESRMTKEFEACPDPSTLLGTEGSRRGYERQYKNLDKINLAIVGAGGFCKTKLLPLIAQANHVTIHTIIDKDPANSLSLQSLYQTEQSGTNYQKVLENDQINTVLIATPHVLHAEQSIDCLKAGKAVFVEKPAAVSEEQLNELESFLAHHKNVLYCVDFNRSFAPLITTIKKTIQQRSTPLMISYRMNAGYLPQDHWVQSAENKGRIIGEACHIFELFCFLTDAQPVTISVAPLTTSQPNFNPTDNFSAQLTMSDGSCCSLLYTATGNNAMGKEYLELFWDGKSIIMRDYLELKGYGLPLSFNKQVTNADKGHAALLNAFFDCARTPGTPWPIPLKRIIVATKISLIADKLARAGGGMQVID